VTQFILEGIGVLLTVMVLSRIFGTTPLFRTAQYIFVGVSLGLAFVIAYQEVLRPAVVRVSDGNTVALTLYGVPLALGLLLLPRITRRQQFSWLANIPLALVFGVGAALAVGGAVAGTLVPQLLDTSRPRGQDISQIIGMIVLAFGTIATLSTFYFTVPRESRWGRLVRGGALIGHWLLMIAFGFFFASAVQSYLSALTERLQALIRWVGGLF
jgi:hypothetical protein